jgi:AraC family transcriptional regulator
MNSPIVNDFHGDTIHFMQTNDIGLRQVTHQAGHVDWHHHDQAFFSLVLAGKMTEATAHKQYTCQTGTLLFQNWEDRHHNTALRPITSFYVTVRPSWFRKNMEKGDLIRGHAEITHPAVKILFHRIFRETKTALPHAGLAIEELLLQAADWMARKPEHNRYSKPEWIRLLNGLLRELPDEQLSLENLSEHLGIHRIYLCRVFSKYYCCTLSDYLRKLKVDRSLNLMRDKRRSLTEIAFNSGFADQSHFIRCFKTHTGLTPNKYRELIS